MRNYYRRQKPKDNFNDKGKILLISYLDTLSMDELKKQKKFYENDKESLIKIFNKKINQIEKNKFTSAKNELRPLLKKLLDEIKIVGNENFYKVKKTYFENKKLLSKNEVWLTVKLYSKNDTKGSSFLKIAKLIAEKCEVIKAYEKHIEELYEIMNKFYEDHKVGVYQHPQSENYCMFDKNFDKSDLDFLQICTYGDLEEEKSEHQSRYKVSSFFQDSICEPQLDGNGRLDDYKVDYVPVNPPHSINFYNHSDFMSSYLKIKKNFNINYTPAPGEDTNYYKRSAEYSLFQEKSIEFIEKFLRKIDLAIRAKSKANKKDESIGYVYVLSNEAYPNIYKIGSTYGLPEERAEELTGTGHLTPFKVVGKIKIQSAEYYEKSIHKLLNKFRVKQGREFFKLDLIKIKECLKQVSSISEKGSKRITLMKMQKEIKF